MEAQYDSSEAALGVAEAEKDLITSINKNTAALQGWRGDYDVNQSLTKGRGTSLLSENNHPDNPGSIDYNADQDPNLTTSTMKNARPQAVGIDYVPYDNFPALLHQGERVQTAVEARSERRSPATTITGNSFSIREDADMDRVASALLQKIELAERRAAVRDKMTAAGNTTAEMIRQPAMTLTGYEARVVLNSSDYSFSLEFLGEENTLADIDVRQVRRMVEQIKPAHLQFMISGLTWDDTESTDPTWQWFECHSLVGLRVMVEVIP